MEAEWRMEFDERRCVTWVAHVHRYSVGENLVEPTILSAPRGWRLAVCECGAEKLLDRYCV